ncbi:hypothetical protein CVS42_06135 [Aeromonas veronii]|nr:hypothetical protein CVS42_06135 [Aeromonas veronii]
MRRRCGRSRGGRIGINSVLWVWLVLGLATNEIAQTGLSSLPPVTYYSEQLFSEWYLMVSHPMIANRLLHHSLKGESMRTLVQTDQ